MHAFARNRKLAHTKKKKNIHSKNKNFVQCVMRKAIYDMEVLFIRETSSNAGKRKNETKKNTKKKKSKKGEKNRVTLTDLLCY